MQTLQQGETYKWTKQVPEGEMITTFKVLEDNTNPFRLEGDPRPHYMCEILQVTIDGEDQTEQYLEEAFDGESTRGIPAENLEGMQLEEVQEK